MAETYAQILELVNSHSGLHHQGIRHACLALKRQMRPLPQTLVTKLMKLELAHKTGEHFDSVLSQSYTHEVLDAIACACKAPDVHAQRGHKDVFNEVFEIVDDSDDGSDTPVLLPNSVPVPEIVTDEGEDPASLHLETLF